MRAARNLGFVFSGRTPDSVFVEIVSLDVVNLCRRLIDAPYLYTKCLDTYSAVVRHQLQTYSQKIGIKIPSMLELRRCSAYFFKVVHIFFGFFPSAN